MHDDNQPLVSVILPVYNGAGLVEKSIQSVIGQTYPHWELIVVNDGSTDNTLAVLQAIAQQNPKVKVVDQPNGGTSVARNHALSLAQGDWIAMIDGDDLWLPTKLQTELDTLANRFGSVAKADPCIVFSGYYAIDKDDQLLNKSPLFLQHGNLFEVMLTQESVMLPSTVIAHKSVYQAVGGFNAGHFLEDREFFLKVAKQFLAYPTGQRLTLYRQTTEGKCRSVLADYDKALEIDLYTVDVFKPMLTDAQATNLYEVQIRHLFYRFLMYDYMAFARQLYPRVNKHRLTQLASSGDKKALLASLCMMTGVNWLSMARKILQLIYKTTGRRAWHKQLAQWNFIW
jgi:glycosyltransferase involved in cell wall biosynthesis